MKCVVTILLCVIAYCKCYTQSCDQPAGLISVYYNYGLNHASGIGIEAGIVDDLFPLGLIIGSNYIKQKKNNTTESSELRQNDFANFYLKAIARILRVENKISCFIVASPQLSLLSEFDFQSGFKIFLPLSERMAVQVEPLYSLKQKNCLFNFHLSLKL